MNTRPTYVDSKMRELREMLTDDEARELIKRLQVMLEQRKRQAQS